MVGGKAVYQAYLFPAAVVQGVVKIVGEIIISSCGGNACQAAFYKYSFFLTDHFPFVNQDFFFQAQRFYHVILPQVYDLVMIRPVYHGGLPDLYFPFLRIVLPSYELVDKNIDISKPLLHNSYHLPSIP